IRHLQIHPRLAPTQTLPAVPAQNPSRLPARFTGGALLPLRQSQLPVPSRRRQARPLLLSDPVSGRRQGQQVPPQGRGPAAVGSPSDRALPPIPGAVGGTL